MKAIFFFASSGAISTSISPRLRQSTATQGFDGVKWCFALFEITVSVSPGRRMLAHFIRSRHAADAGAENHDVGHDVISS
jgi:hypothetical protein